MKRDPPVDDQILRWLRRSGRRNALEGWTGSIGRQSMPVSSSLASDLLVAGDAARAEVVEEQPDFHPRAAARDQGLEERVGHVVPGGM